MAVITQKGLYPRLLLRNYCLLAFLAGLIAARFIYPGLAALTLILLLSVAQEKKSVHALLLCLIFTLALGGGLARAPHPPPEPDWLVESMGGEDATQRPQALYVQGMVKDVDVYADGRVRLLLEGVSPASPPSELAEQYARLDASLLQALEGATPYPGLISVTLWQIEDIPLIGQTVAFNGRFAKVRGFANPGVFTIDNYWHDRDVWIRGWNVRGKYTTPVVVRGEAGFFAGVRHRLWEDFINTLPGMRTAGSVERPFSPVGLERIQGTGQVFLPALIFGDRSGITPYQRDLLSKATLTHSIALSGLHLSYVGLVGIGLALLVSKLFPAILLHFPRQKLCFMFTIPLALAYLWIGGAPVSLVRSALMLFFFGLILFGNRAQVLLDGLFMAVFLITLIWPWAIFDLSLQLSALSVGAIALFYPLIRACVQRLLPAKPLATRALSVNLAAKSSFETPLSDNASANVSENAFANGLGQPLSVHTAKKSFPEKPLSVKSFFVEPSGGSAHGAKGYGVVQYGTGKLRAGLTLLLMSLCIQVVLAPLLVQVFGAVGLWFPLNLLWLPVLGVVVMPLTLGGLACVCFGWDFGAQVLLYGASLPCDGLMWLLQSMDEGGYLLAPLAMRPHWLGVLGLWVALILLPLVIWNGWQIFCHKERVGKKLYYALGGCIGGAMLAMGITALAWHRYATQDVSLALLDVGQGQAVVLSWPGGRALIDGGGLPSRTFDVGKMVVAPYLTDQRPAKVDWLINSHPDYDHLGGMMHILDSFTITEGFVGNGDNPQGALKEDLERIVARRSTLGQEIWGAGDTILLWRGPQKTDHPQTRDRESAAGSTAKSIAGSIAESTLDGRTRGGEHGLVLEVLWPPRAQSAIPESLPIGSPSSVVLFPASGAASVAMDSPSASPTLPPLVNISDEQVVSPSPAKQYTGNDASLVVRLAWQGKGLALLCGDIGGKSLRDLLATTPAHLLRAEVLVLPHHGSKSSFSKKLYEAVDPKTVLVSCGYKNVWNFPHRDIRETLKAMEKELYSTAEHGMVKVTWANAEQDGNIALTRQTSR